MSLTKCTSTKHISVDEQWVWRRMRTSRGWIHPGMTLRGLANTRWHKKEDGGIRKEWNNGLGRGQLAVFQPILSRMRPRVYYVYHSAALYSRNRSLTAPPPVHPIQNHISAGKIAGIQNAASQRRQALVPRVPRSIWDRERIDPNFMACRSPALYSFLEEIGRDAR